jgi:hypothetical protein
MRLGLLVFALAACSSSASARPAWPRPTPHDTDGGESLAPHAAARTVAAVAASDDDDSRPVDPTASAPAAPAPAAAAPPAAAPPADDDLPITEEIVIEVGD